MTCKFADNSDFRVIAEFVIQIDSSLYPPLVNLIPWKILGSLNRRIVQKTVAFHPCFIVNSDFHNEHFYSI